MAMPLPPLNLSSSSGVSGDTNVYTGGFNQRDNGIGTKDILLYSVIGLVFLVVYKKVLKG